MKINDARFVKGVVDWQGLPTAGRPEAAFVGRSNVGKSSLINLLLGRKNIARTSGTPGKTREFNFYLVNDRFYLVDFPGLGFAKGPAADRDRWQQLMGAYLDERAPLRVAVHLIDSRHPPTPIDRDVAALLRGQRVPYLVALTKADKLSGNGRAKSVAQAKAMLRDFGLEAPVVLTSAQTGRGKKELLGWVDSLV